MEYLKTLIFISLLAFNCHGIEKYDAIELRMLVDDDDITVVAQPPLEECLKPMKRVLQDSSGIKTTLKKVDGGDDYLYVEFPLTEDLSGCAETITYNMFFMKASEQQIADGDPFHIIDDFDSKLQDSSLFSTSTEGTAKYYWNFKVPLKTIDAFRKSGFWTEENTAIDQWSTMVYIGLNANHAQLKETFIFT